MPTLTDADIAKLDATPVPSAPKTLTDAEVSAKTLTDADIAAMDSQGTPEPVEKPSTSTGNAFVDFGAEMQRGALNSFAQAADMVGAANTMLANTTKNNLDTGGNLKQISSALKAQAATLPSADNAIVSALGQFVGSAPATMAEFAGSGGGAGFVIRSAILGALNEFSKDETAVAAVKGAVVDGSIGAVFNKIPALMEGFAKVTKKFGETAGKQYIKATANVSDAQVEEIMGNIAKNPYKNITDGQYKAFQAANPNARNLTKEEVTQRLNAEEGRYSLHPNDVVPNYAEARTEGKAQLEEVKAQVKQSVDAQKASGQEMVDLARKKADDAISAIQTNNERLKTLLVDARKTQTLKFTGEQDKAKMLFDQTAAARNAAESQVVIDNAEKGRAAVSNSLGAVISNAQALVSHGEEALGKQIGTIRQGLEKIGQDNVPTALIDSRIKTALSSIEGKKLIKWDGRQFVNNTGADHPLTQKICETLNNMRSQLVTAPKGGKTNLSPMLLWDHVLDTEIKKGFNNGAIGTDFAEVLSKFREAINPTKIYEANKNEVPNLADFAASRLQFHGEIDTYRKALKAYGDNGPDVDKLFKAFKDNDTAYLDKIKAADKFLPEADRMFEKMKQHYVDYAAINTGEKAALEGIKGAMDDVKLQKKALFDQETYKQNAFVTQKKRQVDNMMRSRLDDAQKLQAQSVADAAAQNTTKLKEFQVQQDALVDSHRKAIDDRLAFLQTQDILRGTKANGHDFVHLAGNMAQYNFIRSVMSLNPIGALHAATLAKVSSPRFAASVTRNALNMPAATKGTIAATRGAADALTGGHRELLKGLVVKSNGDTMQGNNKKK